MSFMSEAIEEESPVLIPEQREEIIPPMEVKKNVPDSRGRNRKNNADAYVALAECDAYHVQSRQLRLGNRRRRLGECCEAGKRHQKATAFIDMRYGGRFKGVRSTAEQALLFPRYGISDNDGYVLENVPTAVKRATCEAALKLSRY